jgi:hypothetical protein
MESECYRTVLTRIVLPIGSTVQRAPAIPSPMLAAPALALFPPPYVAPPQPDAGQSPAAGIVITAD